MSLVKPCLGTAALLVVLVGASPALAETCYDNDEYVAGVQKGADLTREGKHLEAFEVFEETAALCPEDPTIYYNMGRANQRLGRCEQSLKYYAVAEEKMAAGVVTDALVEAAKIDQRYSEAREQCLARYQVTCTDPGTTVAIGGNPPTACPTSGEIVPGMTVVEASRDGFETWSETVSLPKGETTVVSVPALQPLAETLPGTLRVLCDSERVPAVDVFGNGFNERLICGESVQLDAGEYTLQVAGDDYTEDVTMELGLTKEVDFANQVFLEEPRTGFFLGLRVATGTGWGSGDVFDADGDVINNYEDTQPTNFPLGLVNELGYAFTETWAVAIRTRVELLNPAVLFQAVGRVTAVQVEWFALRFDLGIGGGQELPMPILFDNSSGDTITGIVKSGPVQASAGVNAAFFVSDIFGIVVAIETHVGFPNFGVQIDWGNVGLEVQF